MSDPPYSDDNILSIPTADNSPEAVAQNFKNYPTLDFDAVPFGERYQGTISCYPNISMQPYDYPKQTMPTLASGYSFAVYAPFNCTISSAWVSRLGLDNAARLFKEDVSISLWHHDIGIDMMAKVTDVADELSLSDIIVEPSFLRTISGHKGDDSGPPFTCWWYFVKTQSIAPRPRFQNTLPILQPPLIQSIEWSSQATEAQWKKNIEYYKGKSLPGVESMRYGMIGDTNENIICTPVDLKMPPVNRSQVIGKSATFGTCVSTVETVEVDGKQIPICQGPCVNPVIDSEGRRWSYENGVSCIFK